MIHNYFTIFLFSYVSLVILLYKNSSITKLCMFLRCLEICLETFQRNKVIELRARLNLHRLARC